jgi:hypothetical protein
MMSVNSTERIVIPHGLVLASRMPWISRQRVSRCVAADGVPQRCLGGKGDGVLVALHLQHGFLGVPDHPEGMGVHVHGHRVPGQRLLGGEVRRPDPGVDELGDPVDQGHEEHKPGTTDPAELPHPQHHRLVPLVHQLHRGGEQEAGRHDRGQGE